MPTSTADYLFTIAIAYLLIFRRKYPMSTLAAVTAAIFLHRSLLIPEYSITSIMFFFAIYAAGVYGRNHLRSPTRGLAIGLMTCGMIFSALFVENTAINTWAVAIFVFAFNWFAIGTAWVLGDTAFNNAKREKQLALQNLQLAASRDEAATQAVLTERMNIARELHDVVAHHVSVIGIQAGAARHTLTSAPEKSTEALEAVELATKNVMVELNSLVGLLREDSLNKTSPHPDLNQLPNLIEQITKTGLDVRLRTFGTKRELQSGIALACYRIVQEALTNVLRHAGPTPRVTVTIRYESDCIQLQVTDDGRGAAAYGHRRYFEPGGNGVIGMHERVALYGGTLRAAPRIGGGWRVHASIPVPISVDSTS